MPKERIRGIATISDRATRIGKLKIGEIREKRGTDGKVVTFPARLDHIKAVDAAGNLVTQFHEVYGDEPKELEAVFLSDNPDDFYWEAYRRYGSGTGLVCHGNGRDLAIVEETGEAIECPCDYALGDRPTCKPVASLSFLAYEVGTASVFQIDTSSVNSIKNIRWFLKVLPQLTGGRLAWIPFRIYIEEFKATHDGRSSTQYQWKLDLMAGMKPADLRVRAAEIVGSFLAPASSARALLDEGRPDDLYPTDNAIDEAIDQIEAAQMGVAACDAIIEGVSDTLTPPAREPKIHPVSGRATMRSSAAETAEDASNRAGEAQGGDDSADEGKHTTETVSAVSDDPAPSVGIPGEVVELELGLKAAMKSAGLKPEKIEATEKLMAANRAKAEKADQFDSYSNWLDRQTKRILGTRGGSE